MPIVQLDERPGLDLGWGHPRADLLPTAAWARATAGALRAYGWQALTYGHATGPAPLIEWLCERAPGTEPAQVFVTAGASHALALAAEVLTRPGDVVLVDSPSYHLAFPILADRGLVLARAPADESGIVPGRLPARDRPPLLYLVPTFANPTGRSLPDQRRRELADLARRGAVTVLEDDTYRDLAYDSPAPASLWELAGGRGVVRIGSFAKTVAPGLRLGWLCGEPALVDRLSRLGYVHSGGGVNHTTALAMAVFGRDGEYDRHLARLRPAYREQRDALVAALVRHGLPVSAPAGGWFVWLPLPPGVSAPALLPVAERRGVSFVPGPAFYADRLGGDDRVRLSFSRLPARDLEGAAERLAAAVDTLRPGRHPTPARDTAVRDCRHDRS